VNETRCEKVAEQLVSSRINYYLTFKNWHAVVICMNGMEESDWLEIFSEFEDSEENSNFPKSCITKTLNLWLTRNGKNATFFSLLGVFQEAKLEKISGLFVFIYLSTRKKNR